MMGKTDKMLAAIRMMKSTLAQYEALGERYDMTAGEIRSEIREIHERYDLFMRRWDGVNEE